MFMESIYTITKSRDNVYEMWQYKVLSIKRLFQSKIIYPKNHAQGLYFVILLNFAPIFQGYLIGTGAIIWLPQCQSSNPEEYG